MTTEKRAAAHCAVLRPLKRRGRGAYSTYQTVISAPVTPTAANTRTSADNCSWPTTAAIPPARIAARFAQRDALRPPEALRASELPASLSSKRFELLMQTRCAVSAKRPRGSLWRPRRAYVPVGHCAAHAALICRATRGAYSREIPRQWGRRYRHGIGHIFDWALKRDLIVINHLSPLLKSDFAPVLPPMTGPQARVKSARSQRVDGSRLARQQGVRASTCAACGPVPAALRKWPTPSTKALPPLSWEFSAAAETRHHRRLAAIRASCAAEERCDERSADHSCDRPASSR